MMPRDTPAEQQRLDALDRYDVLDTKPEEAFDRITRLTRRIFGVSMATVTLLDAHRQWHKSRQGLEADEAPRGLSLCNTTIREDQPLVIPDTLADERFSDNPLVLGPPFVRFYAGVPLRTPDGQNIGTLCAMDTQPRQVAPGEIDTLVDLSRLVLGELELRVLATTDFLTGTLSRRAFRAEAARAVSLAARHRHDLGCIMLDLDHFKAINDRHGHAAGDAILVRAAEACRSHLRASDVLGRIGGEEFAVLVPHSGRAAALRVAEKLRTALAKARVDTPSGPIGVTASFGVAALDRATPNIESLMQRADEALYAAKGDGRNRCVAWSAPVEAVAAEVRRRVLKAGQITFNSGRSTIDCTVRSLSGEGAGLDVISSAGIPEHFKLQIAADGLSRLCRITAKTDRHVDIAFD